jgi:hypothetical protein
MLPPTGSLTGFPIELKQAAQLQHAQDDLVPKWLVDRL